LGRIFPPANFQIDAFNLPGNLAPQVVFPNPLSCLAGGGFPALTFGNQQAQHAFQIVQVAVPKTKACALN
jgi:hypothetical protein